MQLTENPVISSLDLLEKINELRERAGERPLRRNVFNGRIEDELEGDNYKTFVIDDQRGVDSHGYQLTHQQALLVGMRESKVVRRGVLAYVESMSAAATSSAKVLARHAVRTSGADWKVLHQAREALGDEEFWAFALEATPVPAGRLPGRVFSYTPFVALGVGDTVDVEGEQAHPGLCKGYRDAMNYGAKAGKRFSGRKLGDGLVRITRVS